MTLYGTRVIIPERLEVVPCSGGVNEVAIRLPFVGAFGEAEDVGLDRRELELLRDTLTEALDR